MTIRGCNLLIHTMTRNLIDPNETEKEADGRLRDLPLTHLLADAIMEISSGILEYC